MLTELVGVLAARMTPSEIETLLREVGRRLAEARPPSFGSAHMRSIVAATVLTELGGVVDAEEQNGTIVLRGYSCPLANAVRAHPATCHAPTRPVEEIIGQPVEERARRANDRAVGSTWSAPARDGASAGH